MEYSHIGITLEYTHIGITLEYILEYSHIGITLEYSHIGLFKCSTDNSGQKCSLNLYKLSGRIFFFKNDSKRLKNCNVLTEHKSWAEQGSLMKLLFWGGNVSANNESLLIALGPCPSHFGLNYSAKVYTNFANSLIFIWQRCKQQYLSSSCFHDIKQLCTQEPVQFITKICLKIHFLPPRWNI